MAALALENGLPAPLKSHPAQILHRCAGELLRAALRVEVLHAQKNPAAGIAGTAVCHGKSQRMPEMQITCGGGSETTEIFHVGDEAIFGVSG
jgi:hypothetical protein